MDSAYIRAFNTKSAYIRVFCIGDAYFRDIYIRDDIIRGDFIEDTCVRDVGGIDVMKCLEIYLQLSQISKLNKYSPTLEIKVRTG